MYYITTNHLDKQSSKIEVFEKIAGKNKCLKIRFVMNYFNINRKYIED